MLTLAGFSAPHCQILFSYPYQVPLQPRLCYLTPYTCLAPALAANMERMPVPLPTSSTILSLKTCLLWYMEFL